MSEKKEQLSTFTNSTIDKEEVEKFSIIAEQWWDEDGKFKPLHRLNPLRISFIKEQIINHFSLNISNQEMPLAGINILDVGCGGGLLAEPLARLGANVMAIDASEKNIKIAKAHADISRLDINYQNITVEELAETKIIFDVVLAMEVVEHVANIDKFLQSIVKITKTSGLIFVATINRTIKSYLAAIIGAEYVLRWLPIGTHDWHKFMKPSEIYNHMHNQNVVVKYVQGVSFNPLLAKWYLSKDTDINYIMVIEKL